MSRDGASFKMGKGWDAFRQRLERIGQRAREVDGKAIPLDQIMTPAFIQRETESQDLADWLDLSGRKIQTSQDLEAFPDEELDTFVASTTRFPTWQEMLNAAAAEYLLHGNEE